MKEPGALPGCDQAFLHRRQDEELNKAKAASCSEDRIGHLALARAYARQISRGTDQGHPAPLDD